MEVNSGDRDCRKMYVIAKPINTAHPDGPHLVKMGGDSEGEATELLFIVMLLFIWPSYSTASEGRNG